MTAVAWVVGVVLAAVLAPVWWLRGRFVVVTVLGESMSPTFGHGDRVLVRRARLARARPGDVVVAAWGTPVPGGPFPLTIEQPTPGLPYREAVRRRKDRVMRIIHTLPPDARRGILSSLDAEDHAKEDD